MNFGKCLDFIKKMWLVFLICLIGFVLRYYAISLKPDLHIDEPSSFFVSTHANVLDKDLIFKTDWNMFSIIYGKEYRAKDLQNALFVAQDKTTLRDLKDLRNHNIDIPHPTLYHSILRIWNTKLGDFEYYKYLNHARKLNLIFYLFSFFFMYKLLSLIKNEKIFINLGLSLAFANTGSIMLCTMAREYSMMEMFFILTTYITIKLYKKVVENSDITYQNMFIYSLCFALFLSSGYFSIILASIIAIILITLCLYHKREIHLKKILLVFGVTILLTVILYPGYFDFHYNDNPPSATEMLSEFSPYKCLYRLNILFDQLSKFVFNKITYLLLFLVETIYFLYPKSKIIRRKTNLVSKNNLFIPFFMAVVWILFVILLLPHSLLNYSRYIIPAAPILSLLACAICYRFKTIISSSIIIASILFCFTHIKGGDFLDIDRVKYRGQKVSYHIDIATKFTQNLPIVFVNPPLYPVEHIMFANILPNNVVRFEYKIPPKDNYIYKNYVLICDRSKINEKGLIYTRGNLGVYYIKNKKRN